MPPPLLDSALAIRMNAAPVAGSKEWGELEVEPLMPFSIFTM